MNMEDNNHNSGGAASPDKVTARGALGVALAVSVVCAAAIGFLGGPASAAPDASIVGVVTTSGTTLADTMKAIGMALIPLALGVFVVKKGWRIVKGFF